MTATKGIDFDRNVRLAWLDETVMLAAEGLDHDAIRLRLLQTLADDIPSHENRRKTIMVLGRVWTRSAKEYPDQQAEALRLLEHIDPSERVWLHYGMTLITHPFFRSTAGAIGQLARQRETFTRDEVKKRLIGEFGELGTLPDSVGRVVYSLIDWGAVTNVAGTRGGLRPLAGALRSGCSDLRLWLLECALTAMPRHELLLPDLLRLPELFPFDVTIGRDDIRRAAQFDVQRQGDGWDVVALRRRS